MIKINLLINDVSVSQDKPATKGLSFKKFLLITVSFVVICAVCAFAFVMLKEFMFSNGDSITGKVGNDVVEITNFSNTVVEETVNDLNDKKMPLSLSGLLTVPYKNMTPGEQILYGSIFTQKVTSLLNLYAGRNIDFNTVKIKGYSDFYILGLAGSKRSYKLFVKKMRRDPACYEAKVLLCRPSKASVGKTVFAIKGKFFFGFNYGELGNFNILKELPGDSEYMYQFRKLRTLGKRYGIKWSKLKPVSMKRVGNYSRHKIAISGSSTYKQYVDFIERMGNLRGKISFSNVSIRAASKYRVNFDIDAYMYTMPD